LARQTQKVRVPDHEQFDALRGFGGHPNLKDATKLVDGTHLGSVNLANVKIRGVCCRVLFPDPNHFTIVHGFVK
jgi:hypothetical protein